ncbi:MAG: FadR family transcriptional regulator [Spirochaetes bacterium]|nr:MAG: FadR family transcriptional regulator [Spirochaetota bacterium]
MTELLAPIQSQSLVEVFVERFERLILSGQISVGERLPSERELALKLGVSRPVVHEGLVELQVRGLVSVVSRKGVFVNDYRKQGSLAMLESLLVYQQGALEPRLMKSLLEMRRLFECETARMAARIRAEDGVKALREIVDEEKACDHRDTARVVELDFQFHLNVAIASGNLVYPLLMNSFRGVYTNITGQFFTVTAFVVEVFGFHEGLALAIEAGDEERSCAIMQRLLEHGAVNLEHILGGAKASRPPLYGL